MIFKNRPLAIAPAFLHSIEALASHKPKPRPGAAAPPKGTRIAFEELVGVMTPETTRPLASRLLRYADDDTIGRVLLYVDSPGGTVDGTPEATVALRRLAARKRVDAFAESHCCSGALWFASQATTITASPSTLIGSIGVIHMLLDESEAAKQMGVKVVTVSTSGLKTAGIPGTEVTDEHVKMLNRLVDVTFANFEAAIARGRKLEGKKLDAVSTGDVWYAATAKHLGLIDDVQIFEDWMTNIVASTPTEKYADLAGQAAFDQYMQLANAGLSEDDDGFCDVLGHVDDEIRARIAAQYPALAAAAQRFNDKPAARDNRPRFR